MKWEGEWYSIIGGYVTEEEKKIASEGGSIKSHEFELREGRQHLPGQKWTGYWLDSNGERQHLQFETKEGNLYGEGRDESGKQFEYKMEEGVTFKEEEGVRVAFRGAEGMFFEGSFEELAPQITGQWELKSEGYSLGGEFYVWKGIDDLPPTVDGNLREVAWEWQCDEKVEDLMEDEQGGVGQEEWMKRDYVWSGYMEVDEESAELAWIQKKQKADVVRGLYRVDLSKREFLRQVKVGVVNV